MRIAVYTIAHNNIADVRDWATSTLDADHRLIFDLGSSDGTDRALEQKGCTVYRGHDPDLRTDDALNAALALIPADIDFCFRVDFNERPRDGWRYAIRNSLMPVRAVTISTSPSKRFMEPRVHGRYGFRWSGPCRETLIWRQQATYIATPSQVIIDRKVAFQAADIPLLKEGVAENPNADRIFHYAEALLTEGYLQDGLEEIRRHAAMNGAADRTAYLFRLAASIDDITAHDFLIEAQGVYSCPSNYLAFAEYYFQGQQWSLAYGACQTAFSMMRSNPQKVALYTDDPRLREPLLHDIAAMAAWNVWDFEAAYGHAIEALRRASDNAVLRKQVDTIKSTIAAGATLDPDMETAQLNVKPDDQADNVSVQVFRKGRVVPDAVTRMGATL